MPTKKKLYVPRFGSQCSQGSGYSISLNPSQPTNLQYKEVPDGQKSSSKTGVIANTQVSTTLGFKTTQTGVKKNKRINRKKQVCPETTSETSIEKETPHNSSASFVSEGMSDNTDDIFSFLDRDPPPTPNKKSLAKQSVLRTIAKMLQENRLIRRRLVTLTQQRLSEA